MSDEAKKTDTAAQVADTAKPAPAAKPPADEIGGPEGAEPTRFGDWEKSGRCSDF
ncbi:MAG: DUF1674 domain-containing protein [Bacteroidales bacterium]